MGIIVVVLVISRTGSVTLAPIAALVVATLTSVPTLAPVSALAAVASLVVSVHLNKIYWETFKLQFIGPTKPDLDISQRPRSNIKTVSDLIVKSSHLMIGVDRGSIEEDIVAKHAALLHQLLLPILGRPLLRIQ